MPELPVDQAAQPIFLNAETLGQRGDAQDVLAIGLAILHQPAKGLKQGGLLPGRGRNRPGIIRARLRRAGLRRVERQSVFGQAQRKQEEQPEQDDRIDEAERRAAENAGP